MAYKDIKEITLKEFCDWCFMRALDNLWTTSDAAICTQTLNEVASVKPLFGRREAREERWKTLRHRVANLDYKIEILKL